MKYTILIICLLLGISNANAGYLEEMENLGYISGQGVACGAQRYQAYELVSRAYLVSAARSDEEQNKGMIAYNTAKAQGFINQRRSGLYDCDEINERFNNQKIFQTKLYKNGTLKMPDGKVIKPRQKYDATALYNKDYDEREHLDKLYDKIVARTKKQAQKEGIYEKIRRAEAQNRY